MPSQARDDGWSCDHCGMEGFPSFDEAKSHEIDCQESTRKRPRSGSPGDEYAAIEAPQQPITASSERGGGRDYESSSHGMLRHFTIMATDDAYQHQLDRSDALACQNLEIFEAGPEFERDSSQAGSIVPGQVGIRCVHCVQQPIDQYSMYFPGSIRSLWSGIQMVADRHLSQCPAVPIHVRQELQRAYDSRRRDHDEARSTDDEERSQAALMSYCSTLCRNCSIIDKFPPQTGISFADREQQQGHYAPTPHHARVEVPYPPATGPRPPYPNMMAQMGDEIAPTPLARSSKEPQDPAPPPNYGEREGGYSGYPPSTSFASRRQGMYQEGFQTPHTRGDSGAEGPTPQQRPPQESPYPGFPPPYSAYGVPPSLQGDFPFFQDSSSSWTCKYCRGTPPQFRDQVGATWNGSEPPPAPFIDQHLRVCPAYHHSPSMASGVYHGQPSPPGYGFQPLPPPSYRGATGEPSPMPFYSNVPSGGVDPHYSYQPPPPPPPSSGEASGKSRRRPTDSSGTRAVRGLPSVPPQPSLALARPSNVGNIAARQDIAARQAIDYLVAAEHDMYRSNPAAASAEQLVLEEDRMLLTDYFFYLMKQLRVCRFAESDRKTRGGKRENITVGYGGLQCIHCADAPNARKFFWSNVDRLANSFAEIPAHVLKCRRCPQQTKSAILDLKVKHPEQMAKLPRGSQKVFFRRMWRRLHESDPATGGDSPEEGLSVRSPIIDMPPAPHISERASPGVQQLERVASSPGTSTDESAVPFERPTEEAAKALAASSTHSEPPSPSSRILLGIPEDKEWLSDMDCFIRRNLEVFCATAEDVKIASEDRKYPIAIGQVGMRCIHCALVGGSAGARGSAVAFPYSISGIYEAVREFQRLHLESCPNLPPATKQKLDSFKGSSSLSSVLRKYYVLAANALGMYDTTDGIRSGAKAVPLGSSAAFAFAEEASLSDEMRKEAGDDEPPAAFVETGPKITPLESRKRKTDESSGDPTDDAKLPAAPKREEPTDI